jgi:two-component system NarL family response regulator
VILLASPSPELLHRWEEALRAFGTLVAIDQADSVRTSLLRERPQMLLLDLDLRGLDTPKAIARARNLSLATSIVALSGPISEETEVDLFKAGVRGYCRNSIDPQLLKRVVVAVQLGELWVRRSLMSRLLDELGVRSSYAVHDKRAVIGRLACLTVREHEIAALVGSGGTNKEIARQLDISERTVKAHLTEIFRKLGIADRLKLALLIVANNSA